MIKQFNQAIDSVELSENLHDKPVVEQIIEILPILQLILEILIKLTRGKRREKYNQILAVCKKGRAVNIA